MAIGADISQGNRSLSVRERERRGQGRPGVPPAQVEVEQPLQLRLVHRGASPSGHSLFSRSGRRGSCAASAVVVEGFGEDPAAVLGGVMSAQGQDAARMSAKLRDALPALILDEHRAASDPIARFQSRCWGQSGASPLQPAAHPAASLQACNSTLWQMERTAGTAKPGPPAQPFQRSQSFCSASPTDWTAMSSSASFPDLPSLAIGAQESKPSLGADRLCSATHSGSLPCLGRQEWVHAFGRMGRALQIEGSNTDLEGAVGLAAAVVLLQGRRLTVACVGPCRAVLGLRGQDGPLRAVLLLAGGGEEGKRKDWAGEAQRLLPTKENASTRELGLESFGSAALASGASVLPEAKFLPDITQIELQEGAEVLVLATEAVWKAVGVDEALSIAKQAATCAPQITSRATLSLYWHVHSHSNAARCLVELAKRRAGMRGSRSMAAVVFDLKRVAEQTWRDTKGMERGPWSSGA